MSARSLMPSTPARCSSVANEGNEAPASIFATPARLSSGPVRSACVRPARVRNSRTRNPIRRRNRRSRAVSSRARRLTGTSGGRVQSMKHATGSVVRTWLLVLARSPLLFNNHHRIGERNRSRRKRPPRGASTLCPDLRAPSRSRALAPRPVRLRLLVFGFGAGRKAQHAEGDVDACRKSETDDRRKVAQLWNCNREGT